MGKLPIVQYGMMSAKETRRRFSMSKKEFKRAVGNLYKKKLIELWDNKIGLLKE